MPRWNLRTNRKTLLLLLLLLLLHRQESSSPREEALLRIPMIFLATSPVEDDFAQVRSRRIPLAVCDGLCQTEAEATRFSCDHCSPSFCRSWRRGRSRAELQVFHQRGTQATVTPRTVSMPEGCRRRWY